MTIHIGAFGLRSASYMKSSLFLQLTTTAEQSATLVRLQSTFAEACSVLGPIVAEHRCWNRVALHHLAYKKLREQFPSLGSQMACNAIYSVCRSARLIYQNQASPWAVDKRPGEALPILHFAESAPVYFDRHTLSVRAGVVSLYTLDGRLRFQLGLSPADERRFCEEKLKEIVLSRNGKGFYLAFTFGDTGSANELSDVPEYLLIIEPAIQAA